MPSYLINRIGEIRTHIHKFLKFAALPISTQSHALFYQNFIQISKVCIIEIEVIVCLLNTYIMKLENGLRKSIIYIN